MWKQAQYVGYSKWAMLLNISIGMKNILKMKDTNLYIRLEVKEVYSLPIASIQS